MSLIDGPRFAEFLDDHKEQSIPKETIEDRALLKKLGIKVRRKPEQKTLKIFLLRSFLYRINRKNEQEILIPYLINNNWSDYSKSWKIRVRDHDLHVPFRGKIAFLCDDGTRKWVCHPESSDHVEKIFIQVGELTLPHFRYKAEICDQILRNFRLPMLTPENLKEIKQKTRRLGRKKGIDPRDFLTALLRLNLAIKKDHDYLLSGEGLFLTEIEKVQGNTDLQKAGKLLLRRDHQRYMLVSTVLAWLESEERVKEPYLDPVGRGEKEKEQFMRIVDYSGLNTPAVANVVREYSQFEAFLEWYPREYLDHRTFKWAREYYCFLSCCMDSLGLLADYFADNEITKHLLKTDLKRRKWERHAEYLLRFVKKDELLNVTNKKNFDILEKKLVNSEIIDFNPKSDILVSSVKASVKDAQCPYNVFVVSKVPVKRAFFKDEVLQTLKNEQIFRDPQGHFYYPDFRFILASRLALSFRAFDNILAYELHKDIDFRSRLWLPVLFGVKIKKHKIEESLLSVVREPFDSISLTY